MQVAVRSQSLSLAHSSYAGVMIPLCLAECNGKDEKQKERWEKKTGLLPLPSDQMVYQARLHFGKCRSYQTVLKTRLEQPVFVGTHQVLGNMLANIPVLCQHAILQAVDIADLIQ